MDAPTPEFALAGSLAELRAKGRLVVRGGHRPILVLYDRGRVSALDNRCPHMGFPLDRGSVDDGILTCHWHHARFDLESGRTFDLWADDASICPVEVRNGEVWVKITFGHAKAGTSISLRKAMTSPSESTRDPMTNWWDVLSARSVAVGGPGVTPRPPQGTGVGVGPSILGVGRTDAAAGAWRISSEGWEMTLLPDPVFPLCDRPRLVDYRR